MTTPFTTSWRKKSIRAPGLRPRPLEQSSPGVGGGAFARLALAVDRRDDVAVPLLHHVAPHLAGARELVVVRVELLVEQHELLDARRRRQRVVDVRDLLLDEIVDLRLRGEVGVRRVADLLLLGP